MHVKSEGCLQHLLQFLNRAPPSQEVLLFKNEDFDILANLGKFGILESNTGIRKDVILQKITVECLFFLILRFQLKTSVLRFLTKNATVSLNLPDEQAMSRKFYTKVLMSEVSIMSLHCFLQYGKVIAFLFIRLFVTAYPGFLLLTVKWLAIQS